MEKSTRQKDGDDIVGAGPGIVEAYESMLARVRGALADRNLSAVARAVRIHENTVRGIANGKIRRPEPESLQALADYLRERNV